MLSGMETNTAFSVSSCWRGLGEGARPVSAPRQSAAIKAETRKCSFFFSFFSDLVPKFSLYTADRGQHKQRRARCDAFLQK